ncbi:Rha family transcriptional regulator, partial [Shigella sonnei]
MNTAITFSNESPKVFFKDGRLVTTSQAVADYFDKQHKHVLAKIDTLDCSPEFTSANFSADVQTVEIGNGAERESRCYLITKDGFMFLVMGFTGKKAARLKEAYIEKFNAMEEELHKRPPAAQNSPAPNNGCALLIHF